MSANFLAVLAGIILGVAVLPWQIAVRKVTPGQYLMVQGAVYLFAGAAFQFFQSGKTAFLAIEKNGLQWSIFASTIYAVAIMLVNKSFAIPNSSATIIGAIIAMYPATTVLTEALVNKRWPSLLTIIFVAVIMAGVVGVSLLGKKT